MSPQRLWSRIIHAGRVRSDGTLPVPAHDLQRAADVMIGGVDLVQRLDRIEPCGDSTRTCCATTSAGASRTLASVKPDRSQNRPSYGCGRQPLHPMRDLRDAMDLPPAEDTVAIRHELVGYCRDGALDVRVQLLELGADLLTGSREHGLQRGDRGNPPPALVVGQCSAGDSGSPSQLTLGEPGRVPSLPDECAGIHAPSVDRYLEAKHAERSSSG
jgi:hypothetical protein